MLVVAGGATEWAAWIGAATGLCSLGWNIYLKASAGPKLMVTAMADMILIPSPPGNPKYVSVKVRNVGSATTTLNNLTFQLYASHWKRRRRKAEKNFVLAAFEGQDLPYKLEVGHEWQVRFLQDSKLEELMSTQRLYCGVWHSFSNKSVEQLILRPAKK
jgi:hypothetical protein